MPQVHGAVLDALDFAGGLVAAELNAATDNPLVFEDGTILSGGNFHGQPVAMALDVLAIALTNLATISERRIDRLVHPDLNQGLPPFLTSDAGVSSGFMMAQVTAASLASECKVLSHPASVDTIPTDGSKEDVVPMAMGAAWKLRRVIDNVGNDPGHRAHVRRSSDRLSRAARTRPRRRGSAPACARARAAARERSRAQHRHRRPRVGRAPRRLRCAGDGARRVTLAPPGSADVGSAPRIVRAPRGTQISCKGWQQEAALRMLMNNLDPEVAERPEDLVVYGGIGKAARDWASFDAIVRTLRALEHDETLLVQSGKPVAVFRTHASSPRVLIANSNLVGRWATWETFRELERAGLMMYGQMTAGSWIYIGTQGILQGTYETFGAVARQHFGGSLAGRFVLTAGLGGMGGAQPLAATMNDAVILCVEVDPSRIEKRIATGYMDRMTDELDVALQWVEDARTRRRAAFDRAGGKRGGRAARAREARHHAGCADRSDERARHTQRLRPGGPQRSRRRASCAARIRRSTSRARRRRLSSTCAQCSRCSGVAR